MVTAAMAETSAIRLVKRIPCSFLLVALDVCV
jgi:hypothetical protein